MIAVLTSFDDFPVHQSSLPIALTASSDPNHYDRYFFNGYSTDQTGGDAIYFALALGLYPNRHVADASFSVVVGGRRQHNVHSSRRAPTDRAAANSVGPIHIEVLEPLRRHRIRVEANEYGLEADLIFERSSQPLEEPHFLYRSGHRIVFDYTRLTQFGRWSGWLEVDGRRFECAPQDTWGSRDRSWGVRPVGERTPIGAPIDSPQFYWLWAPLNFGDFSTHFDVNESSQGVRWHESAFIANGTEPPIECEAVDYSLGWRSGTRWMERATLTYHRHHRRGSDDSDPGVVILEPLYDFMMVGLGYGSGDWGHGMWKGDEVTGSTVWDLPVATPEGLEHIHVQTLCIAHSSGGLPERRGIGILETLALGPHIPTGLEGLTTGAT